MKPTFYCTVTVMVLLTVRDELAESVAVIVYT
jgi:hypothetical protein